MYLEFTQFGEVENTQANKNDVSKDVMIGTHWRYLNNTDMLCLE